MVAPIGYDRVTIPDEKSGNLLTLSRVEYERLPLRIRVGLLLEGVVKFYNRMGEEVSPRNALKG